MTRFCTAVATMFTILFSPLITAQTSPVTSNVVRVHVMGPVSKGPLVPSHKEAVANAQAYIDKVNKTGGIAGRKIEIVIVDDEQEPALADKLSKELIERGEVLSFFLPRSSPASLALQKYAVPVGVPVIAPQVGPTFMYSPTQTTFFTVRASYEAELRRAIDLQLRLGRSRFAFLAANDAFGNPLVDAAAKRLAEAGLTPIIEKVDNRAADITVSLVGFLEKRPDVVFLLCSVVCASDYVKQFRARGGSTQFITLSNNSSNAFLKALGDAGRGVIITQVMPLPTSKTVAVSKDYQALCAEAKLTPSYNGLLAYVGARVLVEGLRRAGRTLNRETLRASLLSMSRFDLGDFAIRYGSGDYVGSEFVEETIISRDGTFLR